MGRATEARPLVARHRRLAGDETQPPYRILQAELDERTGRPTKAIGSLEWARDRLADDRQVAFHMAFGRCYEAIRDEARALAAYRRAIQLDPMRPEPRLSTARLPLCKPDEAAQEIKRGLAVAPADSALRLAPVSSRLRLRRARSGRAGPRAPRRRDPPEWPAGLGRRH